MSGCDQKKEEAVAPAVTAADPVDQEKIALFVRYFGNSCARDHVLTKIREMARSYREAAGSPDAEALLTECNQAIRVAREFTIDVPEGIEHYSDMA